MNLIQKSKHFLSSLGETISDFPLSKLSTFKIGGNASLLFKPFSVSDLIKSLEFLKCENVPFLIIGNSSNTLFSDNGFKGVIIVLKHLDFCKKDGLYVEAGAGLLLPKLSKFCLDNSLTGLEFVHDIPGTVGGGVYMNAEGFGSMMSDLVVSVDFLDNGVLKTLKTKDLAFDYAKSIFQRKNYVIVSAKFKLKKGSKDEIKTRLLQVIKERKEFQPNGFSAGCVFLNPPNNAAGELIDRAGLKKMVVGGAVVSEKHANFITNSGNATAEDVLELARIIKERVFEKFGIRLELEILVFDENGKQINI